MKFENFVVPKKKKELLDSDTLANIEQIIEEHPEVADFLEYCRDLQLAPQVFEGKVLDVGSEYSGFMRGADYLGFGENIISLDLSPGGLSKLTDDQKSRLVVAKAEQMPFPDGSFKIVVSRAAMPQGYTDTIKDKKAIQDIITARMEEMWRVLEPGGWLKFSNVEFEGTNEREPVSLAMESSLKDFEERHGVKSKRSLMWIEEYVVERSEEAKRIGFGRLYLVQIRKPSKTALQKLAVILGWKS